MSSTSVSRLMLWISVGAIVGANARFLLGRWITATWSGNFPLATWVINISGSIALGALAALPRSQSIGGGSLYALLGIGFLGAYTTFSTFSLESLRLWDNGLTAPALLYTVSSPVVGIIGAALGWSLVRWLSV